jgi:hypothetical protein
METSNRWLDMCERALKILATLLEIVCIVHGF